MASPDRIGAVHVSRPGTEDLFTVRGKMFIDCTGDGRLGAEAGAPSAARVERAATVVFAVAAVVAAATIMVQNREQWFFHDDFVFAFQRDLADPVSLLRPHFGHNTVLPAAMFQLIYRVVGLNSFWPYQLLVVASHLGVTVVLRAVMLRCRVQPVLATSAAILFLFFGSGREDFTWAFQTTLNGSIVFGFAALLVADRDAPPDRRRALAFRTDPSDSSPR